MLAGLSRFIALVYDANPDANPDNPIIPCPYSYPTSVFHGGVCALQRVAASAPKTILQKSDTKPLNPRASSALASGFSAGSPADFCCKPAPHVFLSLWSSCLYIISDCFLSRRFLSRSLELMTSEFRSLVHSSLEDLQLGQSFDIPSKSSSKDPVPTDSEIPAPALVGKTSYETILWRMVLSASPRTLSSILCITPNSWPGPSSIILRLNDVLPTLVVTENISSGMKYFALLAFEAETSLRLRQNITINQRRREKYNQNLLREAARQAAKEKKERLAAKKRRLKAKRAADEALAVEGTAVEKILAEFQAFTIHNPRRFLQAVVSDFLATRHRKSLFEMVEELQSFVQQLQAAEAGPRFEKVLVRFQTVAGWAQEIRVQVMRGHALTQCWIQTRRFAFQQEHSEDGLGFTVEDE
ncbi:hypothetical protein C8J56DRAFT_1061090 [Mycena floridula]|nr:hypothetical protein C8J56DRAFT_1061090 [Mycena floridula]